MMDGSLMSDGKTPSSYEYNVDVTRRVVEMAHAGGVSVEAARIDWKCSGDMYPIEPPIAKDAPSMSAWETLNPPVIAVSPSPMPVASESFKVVAAVPLLIVPTKAIALAVMLMA